jgi:hypothetical protein
MAERAQKVRDRGGNPGLVDVALGEAARLDSLAGQLPEVWGVTPADLKQAELAALRELFPGLSDGVLSRLLGDRYPPA